MGVILGIAALSIWWRFDADIKLASARVAHGSVLIATRCGPIEYQEAGTGVPLLAVHGSGGGYDQGMALAGAPSALRMAIRHPDRVSALVLLVRLAYKPSTQADSARPLPPWVESTMMRLIGSDFLFWLIISARDDRYGT